MSDGNKTIRDRIDEFIAEVGTSRAHFERRCGLGNGYVRNMNDNISARTLMQICSAYPQLDPLWLITGTEREDARLAEAERTIAELRALVRHQSLVIEGLEKLVRDA